MKRFFLLMFVCMILILSCTKEKEKSQQDVTDYEHITEVFDGFGALKLGMTKQQFKALAISEINSRIGIDNSEYLNFAKKDIENIGSENEFCTIFHWYYAQAKWGYCSFKFVDDSLVKITLSSADLRSTTYENVVNSLQKKYSLKEIESKTINQQPVINKPEYPYYTDRYIKFRDTKNGNVLECTYNITPKFRTSNQYYTCGLVLRSASEENRESSEKKRNEQALYNSL